MSNVDTLLDLFESGRLVRPSADVLNSIDLFRAMAKLAGADGIEGGDGVERLIQTIGPSEHYVFIIIDGLGMSFLEDLPETSALSTTLVDDPELLIPYLLPVPLSCLNSFWRSANLPLS